MILLEQEGENSIGGQAFWSLGGLFMIDSPEQRAALASRTIWSLPGRTGSALHSSTARKIIGRNNGPKPICNLPPEKCAHGCIASACAGFPWSAGRNGVAAMRMATAIQCRAFTSHGVRGRVSLPLRAPVTRSDAPEPCHPQMPPSRKRDCHHERAYQRRTAMCSHLHPSSGDSPPPAR